jgi:hypothetical protein
LGLGVLDLIPTNDTRLVAQSRNECRDKQIPGTRLNLRHIEHRGRYDEPSRGRLYYR